jgi:hypothetical protein
VPRRGGPAITDLEHETVCMRLYRNKIAREDAELVGSA